MRPGAAALGLPACEADTAVRVCWTVMPPLADGTCLYSAGPVEPLLVNPAGS